MIRCKDSVRFTVLRPEIYGLFAGLNIKFAKYGSDCFITCGTEGHGLDDPHTNGYAIDIRCKQLAEEDSHKLLSELRDFLGPRYTVLLEAEGTDNEHLHIQIRKDLWRELLKETK